MNTKVNINADSSIVEDILLDGRVNTGGLKWKWLRLHRWKVRSIKRIKNTSFRRVLKLSNKKGYSLEII